MYRFDAFWRNQEQRLRKNIVILWFVTSTSKGQMTDVLQNFEKDLLDKKKRTAKTWGQAWSWISEETVEENPSNVLQDLSSCKRRRRINGSHVGDDLHHDARQDWCLGKKGSCVHVFLEREETTVFFRSVMILNVYTPETSRKTQSSWRMWRRLCKKIVVIEDDFYIELDCCVQIMTMTRRCKTWNVRVTVLT